MAEKKKKKSIWESIKSALTGSKGGGNASQTQVRKVQSAPKYATGKKVGGKTVKGTESVRGSIGRGDVSERKQRTNTTHKTRRTVENAYRTKLQNSGHKSVSNMSKGQKKTWETNTKNYYNETAPGRATQGLISGLMLGVPQAADEKARNSASYQVGRAAGTLATYMGGYGAAGNVLGKGAAKAVASKAGTKAVAKMASRKGAQETARKLVEASGKKVTQEAIENMATSQARKTAEALAKNAMGDATVGTALDMLMEHNAGVKFGSKEWKRDMAINAALNAAGAGASDVLPQALRNRKIIKSDSFYAPKADGSGDFVRRSKAQEGRELREIMEQGRKDAEKQAHFDRGQQLRDRRQQRLTELRDQRLRENRVTMSDLESRVRPDANASADIRRQSADVSNTLAKARTRNHPAWKDADFDNYIKRNGINIEDYARNNGISLSDAISEQYAGFKGENVVRSTKTTRPKASIKSARNAAKDITSRYGSDASESTARYYTQIKEALDRGDEVLADNIAREAAKDIVATGGEKEIGDDVLKQIQDDLRSRRLHVGRETTNEFAEGWGAERKSNFGKMNVSSLENAKEGGRAVNSLDGDYAELQEMYGKNYFPDVDTPQAKYQVIRDLANKDTADRIHPFDENMSDDELESLVTSVKNDILDSANDVQHTKQNNVTKTSQEISNEDLKQYSTGEIYNEKTTEGTPKVSNLNDGSIRTKASANEMKPMSKETIQKDMGQHTLMAADGTALKTADEIGDEMQLEWDLNTGEVGEPFATPDLAVSAQAKHEGHKTEIGVKRTKPGYKDRMHEWWMEFRKRWTDQGAAVYDMDKSRDKVLYAMYDQANAHHTIAANSIAGDGQYILRDGGYVRAGDSLKQILKPVYDQGEDYAVEFQTYLLHRQNIPRAKEGRHTLPEFTSAESKKMVADLEKNHPEFKDKAQEVYQYLHNDLENKVAHGVVSKKHAEYFWKHNPDYVPTHRRLDNGGTGAGGGVGTGGNTISPKTGIMTVKGSRRAIIPLFEDIAMMTEDSVKSCLVNNVGYQIMKQYPDWVVKANTIKDADVIKMLRQEDNAVENAAEDLFKGKDSVPTLWKDGNTYNMIVRQGDINYSVQIDKHVFDAIAALDRKTPKLLGLSNAQGIFRQLVTSANPLFAVRNGIRDILDAPTASKHGIGTFLSTYPKAWAMMLGNSEEWKLYKALGGESGGFFDIAEGYKDHSWFRKATLDRIEALNGAVEQAPRFTEFLCTINKEGTDAETIMKAIHNAREVTVNFGRGGSIGKAINANAVPFFNAGVQDIVRIVRTVEEGRLGNLIMGCAVLGVAPSVFNELMYGDDPNYQNMRQSDKDTNFLISLEDGRYLKLPKGRLTGVVASGIQRKVGEMRGKEVNADNLLHNDEDTLDGIVKNAIEQLAPVNPVTNNFAAPIVGVTQSKEGRTWYGTDIVPKALQKSEAKNQYDENTTELAKFLGEKTNYSPKKIDYLIKQYSGVGGQVLMPMMTPATKADGIEGNVASILKKNFTLDAVANNGVSTKFYDLMGEYESKYTDYGGSKNKAVYDYLKDGNEELMELNKKVKQIEARSDLKSSEKEERVREIRRKQTELEKQYIDGVSNVSKAATIVDKQCKRENYSSEDVYKEQFDKQMDIRIRGADKVFEEDMLKEYKKLYKQESIKVKNYKSPRQYYEAKKKQLKDAGLSVSKYYAVRDKMRKYSGSQYVLQAVVAIDNGIKNYDQMAAIKSSVYDSSWNIAATLKNKGYSTDYIADFYSQKKNIKNNFDADENGYLKKSEAMAYVDNLNVSQKDKAAIYLMLMGHLNWANPYE